MSAQGKTVAISHLVPPVKIPVEVSSVLSEVQLWDIATGKPIARPIIHPMSSVLQGMPSPIEALAFSPDGQTLLTGSNRTARRWDVVSGKEVGKPFDHPEPIATVAYSPDGRVVAVGSARHIRFWDATSGKLIGNEVEQTKGILGFAFGCDGKTLSTAGLDGVARFWDRTSGKETGQIETGDGPLHCVAFSPDGSSVITGSKSGVVRVYDRAMRKPVGPPLAHPQDIVAVAFQPGGQTVSTATSDGTVRSWDLAGSPATAPAGLSWKPGATIHAIAFHPDGHSLLTANASGVAQFWDARTGAALGPPLKHPGQVLSAAISPDGNIALTACFSRQQQGDTFGPKGAVFRWDVASGAALGRLAELPALGVAATFVHGSQAVLVTTFENIQIGLKLRLLDAVSGKPIGEPLKSVRVRIDHIALSPNGRQLLTGSHLPKSARLLDFWTGQPLSPVLDHPDWVTAVAFSPDGSMFATGCKDGVTRLWRLWDTATAAPHGEVMVHKLPVVAVTFSPDGKTLLTGCSDDLRNTGEIGLWDASNGRSIAPIRVTSEGVTAIAFGPDGQTFATATDNLLMRNSASAEMSVWRLPEPAAEDVERLRLTYQIWTGLELRSSGDYRPLSPESWLQRKRESEGSDTGR
jgi:WD40 repeat protein